METVPAETSDLRVQFDLSNGGGIQGQGFRLDIHADDVDDAELGGYIVSDLRLLMVGEVRILNKEIIRERHKRSARASAGGGADDDGRVRIDLSHVVEDGMVTYRGLPAPVVCDYLTREASRAQYAEGTEFQIGFMAMSSNTGTYVDSPFHRYADGDDLSALPLHRLADLEAVTVNVVGGGRAVDREQLLAHDVRGKAVLVHTGWDAHWGSDAYFESHPHLTAAAADHLASQGVMLVGIDSLNIDDTSGGERPVHSRLLGEGIPICEHLTGLQRLPSDGFRFSAVPVKVRGMEPFPCALTRRSTLLRSEPSRSATHGPNTM